MPGSSDEATRNTLEVIGSKVLSLLCRRDCAVGGSCINRPGLFFCSDQIRELRSFWAEADSTYPLFAEIVRTSVKVLGLMFVKPRAAEKPGVEDVSSASPSVT